MNRPIRQGEVMLVPVADVPSGGKTEQCDSFIVGHSETGHHHVLESTATFEVLRNDRQHRLYVRLFDAARLVHQKDLDAHKPLTVPPGTYRVVHKTEWDPWSEMTSSVFD